MSAPNQNSSAHGCTTPNCRSFRFPTPYTLNNRTCLTVVYDKNGNRFAYYSQHPDRLTLQRAPKPLMFVPDCAAKAGYEGGSVETGRIKLNHPEYEGKPQAAKGNRTGVKVGPSKLRNELLANGNVVVSSPQATEAKAALPLRNIPTTSHASPVAASAPPNPSGSTTKPPTSSDTTTKPLATKRTKCS